MKNNYIKYSPLIFLGTFILAFAIGMSNDIPKSISITTINTNPKIDFETIKTISIKNILLALTLLLGFLTANILNYILLFFNGLMFGMSYTTYSKIFKTKQLLLIVLPHAIIEVFWMVLISSLSVKLFFYFLKYINSNYTNKEFINLLKSKYLFKLFFIVILAIIIELFITPLLFNLTN